MPATRLTMRKIREVLRLTFDCRLTKRQIAKSCAIARSTVAEYLRRFTASGLNWPLSPETDDEMLDQRLFPPAAVVADTPREPPDFVSIHRELRRKAVTLMLLWQEYKAADPEGYQYSQFCHLYHQWKGQIDPVMRLEHPAGETLFVDWAGMTADIFDPLSGEVQQAQIFVAVLAASGYTYAEATATQQLPDWIGAHCRAFAFFNGVSQLLVPDNTKTGITKACFYEPDINPSYLDMAHHYGTAILPTRVRKPRDKAKGEGSVLLVERWILARIRNETFFSLSELNRRLRGLIEDLNGRPFQKLPGSRRSAFEEIDRPSLKPLPALAYQFAEWKKATVNIDYHVELERHYYSVPYRLLRKKLDVRYTESTVECFYQNTRVASHIRSYLPGRHTTLKEHMPPNHQRWLEWTPERFIRWGQKIGPACATLIQTIISTRAHPQQGFRAALGILRLEKSYDATRLEMACQRALDIGATSYRSLQSILKNGLERQGICEPLQPLAAIEHDNIRGATYYR
jgi:transposase